MLKLFNWIQTMGNKKEVKTKDTFTKSKVISVHSTTTGETVELEQLAEAGIKMHIQMHIPSDNAYYGEIFPGDELDVIVSIPFPGSEEIQDQP